jgi:hypothetical protein
LRRSQKQGGEIVSKSIGESDGWLLYGPYRLGEESGRARWIVRPPERYNAEKMLFFVNSRQLGEFFRNIRRNADDPRRDLRRAYTIARKVASGRTN